MFYATSYSPNYSSFCGDLMNKIGSGKNKKACNHLIFRLLIHFDVKLGGEGGK